MRCGDDWIGPRGWRPQTVATMQGDGRRRGAVRWERCSQCRGVVWRKEQWRMHTIVSGVRAGDDAGPGLRAERDAEQGSTDEPAQEGNGVQCQDECLGSYGALVKSLARSHR